jgi:hypothetical protein
MGNPDLAIVFNHGEISFFINGADYETRKEAIDIGIYKYESYIEEAKSIADKPEELNFEIKSINIYEVIK